MDEPRTPATPSGRAPDTLVIVGVDASGKNHVANVVRACWARDGAPVGQRSGGLAARSRAVTTSEDKGRFALLRERVFLRTFPLTRPLLPYVVAALVRLDLRRSRRVGPERVVVVSYTPLRVLAFALAHARRASAVDLADGGEGLRVPWLVDRTFRRLGARPGLSAVVLDVSPDVRAARIAARAEAGRQDHLDRYMTRPGNEEVAERIEATTVALAQRYLGAVRIVNDDLDDEQIAMLVGDVLWGPTLRP